jgi:hypothetical protein
MPLLAIWGLHLDRAGSFSTFVATFVETFVGLAFFDKVFDKGLSTLSMHFRKSAVVILTCASAASQIEVPEGRHDNSPAAVLIFASFYVAFF